MLDEDVRLWVSPSAFGMDTVNDMFRQLIIDVLDGASIEETAQAAELAANEALQAEQALLMESAP